MSETAFRLTKKKYHLTYKSHIDHQSILNLITLIYGSVIWYSCVHESSDNECSYDHTHFAFESGDRKDSTNPRIFDIDGIHPNIQPIKDNQHASRIFHEYHLKAPVGGPWQSSYKPKRIREVNSRGTSIDIDIKKARTLHEAVTLCGVEIRSVADVQLLRNDKPKPSLFEQQYDPASFNLEAPKDFRIIFIHGGTGTGKTMWAAHQFQSPLIVSHIDTLRSYDPAIYDGIVFDDMSFRHWPRESVIHLCDWDLERAINCRYNNAVIPAHTRKIFTSNLEFEEVFPNDPSGAIRRRVSKRIKVSAPLFGSSTLLSGGVHIDSNGTEDGGQRAVRSDIPTRYAATFIPPEGLPGTSSGIGETIACVETNDDLLNELNSLGNLSQFDFTIDEL